MSLRRLGISNYHLTLRRNLQWCAGIKEAREMLEIFQDDPGAMKDFRRMIVETGASEGIIPDSRVLELMAKLLANGELILVRDYPMQGGNAVTQGKSTEPDSAPSAAPVSTPLTPPPENPTFPPDANNAAQASNLQNAAQSGQPFATQCKYGNCSGCGGSGSC